jgi:hypothetical protein
MPLPLLGYLSVGEQIKNIEEFYWLVSTEQV